MKPKIELFERRERRVTLISNRFGRTPDMATPA